VRGGPSVFAPVVTHLVTQSLTSGRDELGIYRRACRTALLNSATNFIVLETCPCTVNWSMIRPSTVNVTRSTEFSFRCPGPWTSATAPRAIRSSIRLVEMTAGANRYGDVNFFSVTGAYGGRPVAVIEFYQGAIAFPILSMRTSRRWADSGH
jgi:hypothetical protein